MSSVKRRGSGNQIVGDRCGQRRGRSFLTVVAKLSFSKLTPLPLHATFFSKSLNHFLLLLSKNLSFSLRNLTISLLRSPFRHRRSTFGVKSFQINRSVCETELISPSLHSVFELSSVDGRRTCSGEIVLCLCERPVTLKEGDELVEEALEEENLVEDRSV
ncbi:hypothetical protein LR48_Vigan07g203000 [Vigna angularis]|uniref:Uncharacterized protein n=1 Tax=Phaseolus angularis TaxID=3914 RepID=A0A0L9V043_PHAAN|nr:hypothetical protein LR48_Vigan07g203000 [Vigna angularis]